MWNKLKIISLALYLELFNNTHLCGTYWYWYVHVLDIVDSMINLISMLCSSLFWLCRWLVFCHVPAFCDSLPHFETTLVFGRTLLRAVFRSVYRQLMDKCHNERDRMPPEKRVLVLTHFPRWIVMNELWGVWKIIWCMCLFFFELFALIA